MLVIQHLVVGELIFEEFQLLQSLHSPLCHVLTLFENCVSSEDQNPKQESLSSGADVVPPLRTRSVAED